jgi:hypothetical protein
MHFIEEEEDQLPTARMATITRASFWVYFTACTVLFVCSLLTPRHLMSDWAIPAAIALCIFADLLLEIIRQRQGESACLLLYICYGFEAISAVLFAIIVFGKLFFH